MNNFTENNLKFALYMGAVLLGEYLGEKGGYSNTKLLDFSTEEVKTSAKKYKLDLEGYPENSRYWSDTTLKYHKSWSWLMPVLQKMTDDYNENVNNNTHYTLTQVFTFTTFQEAYNHAVLYLTLIPTNTNNL